MNKLRLIKKIITVLLSIFFISSNFTYANAADENKELTQKLKMKSSIILEICFWMY